MQSVSGVFQGFHSVPGVFKGISENFKMVTDVSGALQGGIRFFMGQRFLCVSEIFRRVSERSRGISRVLWRSRSDLRDLSEFQNCQNRPNGVHAPSEEF